MRILVVTAVAAEREAVWRGLQNNHRFEVLAAGVGAAAAAAATARALTASAYGLVVNAGIGGGFPGRAEVGSLVVADAIVAADLGVRTAEGFLSLDELGLGATRLPVDPGLVRAVAGALRAAGLPVRSGTVLTVATVTGTAESAAELAARIPGAAAEAMEGYGAALAARECGVPVLELRAVSNLVGPRDREVWRVAEALEKLSAACRVLPEVLLKCV